MGVDLTGDEEQLAAQEPLASVAARLLHGGKEGRRDVRGGVR